MSVLAEAPLGVERANFRTIDGRMMSGINSPRPDEQVRDVGRVRLRPQRLQGHRSLSGNANLNTLTVGGDVKLSDKLPRRRHVRLLGEQGRLRRQRRQLQAEGNDRARSTAATATARGTSAARSGAGDLDYSNVNRNIQLGALTRTESGDTSGWHFMASVLGGYWFQPSADLQHGPFVRVAYQEIRVDGIQRERHRQHGADLRRSRSANR